MSADRLRAAAAECRRVPGQVCHDDDLQQALADWLDNEVWEPRPYEAALRIADLILGGAS